MSDTSNQPSRNHPCGDLLDQGRRRDYIKICVPLYQASLIGDREAVENILNINPELDLLGYSITEDMHTTLMFAVSSESIKFVEHLVNQMTDQQLALQDKYGRTALYRAAGEGTVDMARAMLGKCPQLLTIRNNSNKLPIHAAAVFGKHDMVAYLYDEYKSMAGGNYMTDNDIHLVFLRCIEADLFDSALRILDGQNNQIGFGFPHQHYARLVLYNLAQKTSAFKHIKSWKIQ